MHAVVPQLYSSQLLLMLSLIALNTIYQIYIHFCSLFGQLHIQKVLRWKTADEWIFTKLAMGVIRVLTVYLFKNDYLRAY